MAEKEQPSVTMRVRIGDNELEVTGPSDFVEKKIAEFHEQQKATSPIGSEKGHLHSSTQTLPKSTKDMSSAQFFKKASLKNDNHRVLAAGYFLEKFKNSENFTAAEVAQIIKHAKIPPPTNPNDAVNQNIRKGYIMSAGDDREGRRIFVLTTDGEEAIEALLNA